MAVATRYQIQKEVFGGSDERVLVIVSVTKSGRKKRASFLVISGQCLSKHNNPGLYSSVYLAVNKQEDPPVVEITRVKSSEKKEAGKESYKRVKSWILSELKSVDGHGSESLEFDLTFDKQTFKWIAATLSDKRAFITQLYKVHLYCECVCVCGGWSDFVLCGHVR